MAGSTCPLDLQSAQLSGIGGWQGADLHHLSRSKTLENRHTPANPVIGHDSETVPCVGLCSGSLFRNFLDPSWSLTSEMKVGGGVLHGEGRWDSRSFQ